MVVCISSWRDVTNFKVERLWMRFLVGALLGNNLGLVALRAVTH